MLLINQILSQPENLQLSDAGLLQRLEEDCLIQAHERLQWYWKAIKELLHASAPDASWNKFRSQYSYPEPGKFIGDLFFGFSNIERTRWKQPNKEEITHFMADLQEASGVTEEEIIVFILQGIVDKTQEKLEKATANLKNFQKTHSIPQ